MDLLILFNVVVNTSGIKTTNKIYVSEVRIYNNNYNNKTADTPYRCVPSQKITVYRAVQIFSFFLLSLYLLSLISFSSHSFFFQQPIQIFCTTSYTAGLFQ